MGLSGAIVNGAFADSDNFQIDGVSDNEYTLGLVAVNPSVDAVAEFKVQTNTYSAEFGRAGGANINIAIKSGTNQFHGGLFEFVRNDKFDATPWDVNRVHGKNPPIRENQFGGNIGGPIKKDRTFFFADFERFTERVGQTDQFRVPDAQQLAGDFSESGNNVIYNPYNTFTASLIAGQTNCGPNANQPCDGKLHPIAFGNGKVDGTNVIPSSNICGIAHNEPCFSPAAVKIVSLLKGATSCPNLSPDAPGTVSGLPNCFVAASYAHDTNNLDVRVDHTIGEKDQFFACYSALSTTASNPNFFKTVIGGDPWLSYNGKTQNKNAVVSEVHSFSPRIVNEFRFGASHIHLSWFGFDSNLKTSDQVGIPGVNNFCGVCGGLSYIAIGGPFGKYFGGGFNSLGHAPFTPTFRHEAVFQWVDDVTLIRDRQTIKLGAAWHAARVSRENLRPE